MPVSRTCTFCGNDIEPGTGKMYVKRDGGTHFFCSSKCQKNLLDLGRVGRKVRWTRRYVRAVQRRAPRARPLPQAEAVETAPPEIEEVAPGRPPTKEAAPEEEREEVLRAFTEVPGIGPATAKALWEAGFTSMGTLQAATAEQVAQVKGLGPATAKKILAHAQEVAS